MDSIMSSEKLTSSPQGFWSSHANRLFISLFGLGLIGCLILYNVTRDNFADQDFLYRQSLWVLLGIGISALLFFMPHTLIRRYFAYLAALWYASLLGLFVFGNRINGARAWYRYKSFCLQPAELGKPIFICLLALLCIRLRSCTSPCKRLGCQLIAYLVCIIPLILQPDWGTALIYSVTFFIIIWFDGLKKQHFKFLAVLGFLLASAAYFFFRHARLRINDYLVGLFADINDMQYHARCLQDCQIKGGWTGSLFSSTDALAGLPYWYSDSLFASATELLGVLGVIPIVLLCFGWLVYCCQRIYDERNPLYQLICLGCGAMITGQFFIHLMVNLNLIPNTGVPLPFFSYGGSSLISTMIMFTLVERIASESSSTPLS